MFSLIRGFVDYFFQAPQYKILIVGTEGSGKTSLLNKLKQLAKMEYLTSEKITKTIGLNLTYITYQTKNNYDLWAKNYQVLYWDVGGSLTQRSLWKKFFPECHGIIYVLEEGSLAAPDLLQQELDQFLADPLHDEVPILFLVNNKHGTQTVDTTLIKKACQHQVRAINILAVNIQQNWNVIESVKWLHNQIERLFQQYND